MVDYRKICDWIFSSNQSHRQRESSPGYREISKWPKGYFRGSSVADIGCGPGFLIGHVLENGAEEAFGIDVSSKALVAAKKQYPKGVFVVADISKGIPLADSSFDWVFCHDVLQHLDIGDARLAAKELRRICKSGGSIVGTVSCRPAVAKDQFGDNAHRTVIPAASWMTMFGPGHFEYRKQNRQLRFLITVT